MEKIAPSAFSGQSHKKSVYATTTAWCSSPACSVEFDFGGLLHRRCTILIAWSRKKKTPLERSRRRGTIVNRSVCHRTTTTVCYIMVLFCVRENSWNVRDCRVQHDYCYTAVIQIIVTIIIACVRCSGVLRNPSRGGSRPRSEHETRGRGRLISPYTIFEFLIVLYYIIY